MTLTGKWSPRTAFIVFASFFVFLRVLFPYFNFNSDVANYGYMGNDIIKYGYLPTIAYGQNYLFSITPYVYALFRVIAPSSVSDVFVMVAAGGSLTLIGYWLVYESFLLALRMAGKDEVFPGALFLGFLAISPGYHLDMMENSGLEIAVLTLGAMAYASTSIDAVIARGGEIGKALPFVFGAVWSHAMYARPQMTVYGAVLFLALLARSWRGGRWAGMGRLSLWVGVGAVIGYIPMLLHNIFRADKWPFTLKSDSRLGTLEEIQDRIWLFSHRIFRDILTLDWDYPYYSAVMIILAITAVVIVAAIRRKGETPIVATALFWGSLVIMVAMILIPGLSWNAGMRRYILHSYVGFAFLFAFYAAFLRPSARAAMAAVVALALLLSPSAWSKKLVDVIKENNGVIDTQAVIPILAARKNVIIADYWDAYLLGFMAEGKLDIEPFPWQLVRRYGAISDERMRQGTVWIIREGLGGTVYKMIEKDLGTPKAKMEIYFPLFGKRHVYTTFTDPAIASDLMKKIRPDYFVVKYPPGS